tara:strand:- start:877 stop:1125 length:249 start_codon:yes stop_codon:yes gene_type:complete
MKKKRRTKKEIEKESSLIYCDITDTLSYLSYVSEEEIKEKVNDYRINYTDLDRVSISQIRKALSTMMGEGLVKKRKENYKYV